MCRIVGGWEFSGKNAIFDSIPTMRDTMQAGGPDDAGIYCSQHAQLALAHRRLSIIDLSSFSHQPFCSDDGRFVLIFNGEIYNYQQIAKDLKSESVIVKSNSDTEVLLSSLIHLGIDCVKYFEGMFAFAFWDEETQILTICRDRIGVKPLYYYFDNERFLFASELKAIFAYPYLKKQINKEAMSHFFAYGYIPAPLCILEHCNKLESGHFLTIDSKANICKKSYYAPKNYYTIQSPLDIDIFKTTLHESVASRMVSDVPVGVLLSGGIDSSLVCAALKEQGYTFETFTMGFEEADFNEAHFAKQVADCLNIPNTTFVCSLNEAKDLIEKLPYIYDEPFGDSSAIPTLLISQKIRQFVKVALSADGGDELGIGYERYFWAQTRWKQYSLARIFSLRGALLSILSPEFIIKLAEKYNYNLGIDKFLRIKNQLKAKTFMEHYQVEITHFRNEERAKNALVPIENINQYILDNNFLSMTYFDFCNYLSEDILTKTDRASMSVGLEMREPLLGNKFVEFMLSLKAEAKYNNNVGKIPYKQYLSTYLPQELIERPKMGFGIPLESWFRSDLRCLLDNFKDIAEFLDIDFVTALFQAFDDKKRVDFAKIWYIYVFISWRKAWGI